MITLLDYGAGNVRSVVNAIECLGETVRPVSKAEDIAQADKLVFPGVGNFGSMMRILRQKGYVAPLTDYLRSGRPFLGICLGLQALFERSEEAPGKDGPQSHAPQRGAVIHPPLQMCLRPPLP